MQCNVMRLRCFVADEGTDQYAFRSNYGYAPEFSICSTPRELDTAAAVNSRFFVERRESTMKRQAIFVSQQGATGDDHFGGSWVIWRFERCLDDGRATRLRCSNRRAWLFKTSHRRIAVTQKRLRKSHAYGLRWEASGKRSSPPRLMGLSIV